MRGSSRILVAAFFLCQSIAWTCPAYCATVREQSERSETQPASGLEHHHSHHDSAKSADHPGAAVPSLTGMQCNDCGVAAPAFLVRASGPFSVNPVPDAELATPAGMSPSIVGNITFASSHLPDSSPPPGILPLRI
jgi:hypothetical protein